MRALANNAIVKAALLMVIFCATMATLSVLVRMMSEVFSSIELVFFRNFFGFVFMIPIGLKLGRAGLRTKRIKTHLLRAVSGSLAMGFLFTGVGLMPLANFTALTFTAPLFVTLGAALLLGERIRVHRGAALVVGFLGALVLIRPSGDVMAWGSIFALGGAFFMATTMLIVKSLSRDDSPSVIVFYMGLLMTPVSLIAAVPVWVWPTWEQMPILVAIGFVAAAGQIAITKAMSLAPASVVMPFNYMQMIFAASFGYFLFSETLDAYTILGSLIIFGSTVYITIREARLASKG